MIGISGFVHESFFFLVTATLLGVVSVFVWQTPRSSASFSIKGTLALLVLLALPIVSGARLVREFRQHIILSRLDSHEIRTVTIDSTEINDASQVACITEALRRSQWFSVNHGGWAEPVPLRILMKNGEEHEYRVATYLRTPGIIVELNTTGLHSGYAFNSELEGALNTAHVTLPR